MKNRPPYLSKFFSTFSKTSQSLRNSVYGLLFPWDCFLCGALQHYPDVLCEGCSVSLVRIQQPFCKICGSPFPRQWRVEVCPDCKQKRPRLNRIRSCFLYEGAVMEMIRQMKFGRRARYLRYFAEQLYLLLLKEPWRKIEAFVPVPLHRSREWERTFNQAGLLAQYLSELSGKPVLPLLNRRKKTRAQTGLSGLARRRNLSGAFVIQEKTDVPQSVVLIDDVVTTGATLEACARALKSGGVRKVYGLTIARAPLRF